MIRFDKSLCLNKKMTPHEKDLVEILSTPGALAAVVIWFHFRLKRLEDMHGILAERFGIDISPAKRRRKTHLLCILAALGIVAAALAGL